MDRVFRTFNVAHTGKPQQLLQNGQILVNFLPVRSEIHSIFDFFGFSANSCGFSFFKHRELLISISWAIRICINICSSSYIEVRSPRSNWEHTKILGAQFWHLFTIFTHQKSINSTETWFSTSKRPPSPFYDFESMKDNWPGYSNLLLLLI